MKKLQILIQTKEVLNIDAAHLSSVSAMGKEVHEGEKNQTEELGETPLLVLSLIQFFIEWNKSSFSPQATVGYFGQTFP